MLLRGIRAGAPCVGGAVPHLGPPRGAGPERPTGMCCRRSGWGDDISDMLTRCPGSGPIGVNYSALIHRWGLWGRLPVAVSAGWWWWRWRGVSRAAGLSGFSTSGGSGPGRAVLVRGGGVGPEVLPGGRPGPVGGQVHGDASGGGGDPGGDGDQLGRRVAQRARACRAEAAAPAARARLNAMPASASQAALAVNFPEGRCASGPSLSSAMTCSTMAWSRWFSSARDRGDLAGFAVGDEGVVPPDGEQLVLPVAGVLPLSRATRRTTSRQGTCR